MPEPERDRRALTLRQRIGFEPAHPDDLGIHKESGEYSYLLLAYQLGYAWLRPTYEIYADSSTVKDGIFYTRIRVTKKIGDLEQDTEARIVVNPKKNEVRLNFGEKWYVVTADPTRWQEGGYHPGTLEDITAQVAREEEIIRERLEKERRRTQGRQDRIKELEESLAKASRREESLREHIAKNNEAHRLDVERLKEQLTRAHGQAHEVFRLFLEERLGNTIVGRLAEQYSQHVDLKDFTYCGTLAIQIVDQIYGASGPAWNEENRQFTIHVVACWLHTFAGGTN